MTGPATEVPGAGRWNDFASYWLAGKLVAAGHSPYDLDALVSLGDSEEIAFLAGTGYSYPLPFAVAMVPLSTLPFPIAALVFTVLSIAVFGLAVSAWLSDPWLGPNDPHSGLLAALAAGIYPPVLGSVWTGQANLLVFGALALGVRAWLRRSPGPEQELAGGAWIGLAGVVKVVPLMLIVPGALAGRLRGVLGIGLGAAGALAWALALAPFGAARMLGLGRLLAADPYWTNESLNGFASRLAMPTERNTPILPQSDPVVLGWALFGALGAATLALLLVSPKALARRDGFALGLGMTLVAATAAAPKDSFWNHVPALIGAALLLGVSGNAAVIGGRANWQTDGPTRALLVAWFGLALVQLGIGLLPDAALAGIGPASALLSSVALYGLIALWLALARGLRQACNPRVDDRPVDQ